MKTDVDWMIARAGCGRNMPEICKNAYGQYWIDIVTPKLDKLHNTVTQQLNQYLFPNGREDAINKLIT